MNFEKIAAFVPMRHESIRVPGKNYRLIAGKPLYAWIIETLLSCPEISHVMVDTDSELILDGLAKHYPAVKTVLRPEALRADTVPMNEILLYDTAQMEAELYLQTHSTNPLLRPETISKAIRIFKDGWPGHDSLFGVTRWQTRLYDSEGKAINHDPNILLRTQDLPPVYEENSTLYLFTRQNLIERHNRIGARPLLFEVPPLEAVDIDEESDFLIAQALLEHVKKG
ncbi:MAG: acylneuraminate cytidylyltransferase family protein [Anaerolineaceae bacterium]|nr:acylneuraminate cytidylyltransferase family protein [Anaerolineaceae bacterium]